MNLDELLGIDASDPLEQLAEALVEGDLSLLEDLVRIRERTCSQTELGRRIGISQGAVARIESGERDPHLSTLRRYALALGVLIRHEVIEEPTSHLITTPVEWADADEPVEDDYLVVHTYSAAVVR